MYDPRAGVLTLTDPRAAAKKGVMTYGEFCPVGDGRSPTV